MKRTYRDLLLLLGAFAIVWLVFTVFNDYLVPKPKIVTEGTQEKLARNLRTLVFDRYDTLDNQIVNSGMDSIVNRLKPHLDSLGYDFNIYILDDPTINAFTTLQGDIFIFRGLITFSDSPEMLASVIAHEMGHLIHDHYVERLSREVGINVIFTILTGGDASTIGELGKSVFSLQFSREEEREADEFASDLLLKSGISPARSTQFFLKLQREDINNFSEAMEVFTTHPDVKERIESAARFDVPEDFTEQPFDIDWESILSEIE
jgi:predicted Zn-dependent protease